MENKEKLILIIKTIIKSQQDILGPIAIDIANRVNGLTVSKDLTSIDIEKASKELLRDLVIAYDNIFGRASVETCKNSIKPLIPTLGSIELPDILK